jgi:glyoxylate/hydroxypyruvate reductase
MALLLHPGPVPVEELLGSVRTELGEMPVRVWPSIGNPRDIQFALVSRVPAGLFAELPSLRLVGSLHAGVDHLLRDPGLGATTPIVRPLPASSDTLMNEYLLAQVMLHHRNGVSYREAQAQALWRRLPIVPIRQRTVGFLGFGAVAEPAGRLLSQIGFDVAAWVRRPRRDGAVPIFDGEGGLRPLLQRSQILINLLPLTPATEDLLDASRLAQLPQGAALINVGRGEHVVECDLVDALDSGHLAGATLDVFREEPLPASSPLWRHSRIVVTPHACRRVDVSAVVAQFAAELRRVEQGMVPLRPVDRQAGY